MNRSIFLIRTFMFMTGDPADIFLSTYPEPVYRQALALRTLLLRHLPDIIEEYDKPARLLGYSYGRRYADVICTLIPSQKGIKLGFNRGTVLPDPHQLLEGKGKIARYVSIQADTPLPTQAIRDLLKEALALYQLIIQSS